MLVMGMMLILFSLAVAAVKNYIIKVKRAEFTVAMRTLSRSTSLFPCRDGGGPLSAVGSGPRGWRPERDAPIKYLFVIAMSLMAFPSLGHVPVLPEQDSSVGQPFRLRRPITSQSSFTLI
jgi:hypothetical protein